MQREKLASYLGIAMQGGYVIVGSDKLSAYDKKLYFVLLDDSAARTSKKVYDRLRERGIEGEIITDLASLTRIPSCKIIGIKNKGLSEEIKKYLN